MSRDMNVLLCICAAFLHSVFAQSSVCSTQMFSEVGGAITYGERFGVVSGCQLHVLSASFVIPTSIPVAEFKTLHQADFEVAMITYFSQSLPNPPTIHNLTVRVQMSSLATSPKALIVDFMLHSPHRIHGTIDPVQVNLYLAQFSIPSGTFIAVDDAVVLQEIEVVFGTAAIISASVGGVCLIAIIVGICYCCRDCGKNKSQYRKEKRQKNSQGDMKQKPNDKNEEIEEESDEEEDELVKKNPHTSSLNAKGRRV